MVLAGIVISRVQSGTEIIFGGADGALINTDTYSTVDPNATPTPEVDEGWPDIDITQGQYRMVNDDTENLLPSSFEPTCGVIDGTKFMMFDVDALPYLNAMIHAAEDAGVEIRLNTEATGLIIEDNVCLGATVQDRTSTYTIHARKVILATGYAGWDKESVEMFYPELSNVTGANNPGNHSDAQKWMVAMGGETVYYPESNYIVPVYNPVLRDNYEFGWIFQKGHTVWVNSKAERFFDESSILNMGLTDIGAQLCKLEDGQAWMIFDSNNADCVRFADELIGYGVAWSASSVEELAEKTGLPADALKTTLETYNAACESGKDEAFSTPADFMMPVSGETLYAARIVPGSTASVAVTLYCDDDMTITKTQGGQRIENLIGAGGVVGNMVPVAGFGAHVYEALASGTLAGEMARTALIQ